MPCGDNKMKIQFLGFVPVILLVSYVLWSLDGQTRKRLVFTLLLFFVLVFVIASLGWGLSGFKHE